MNQQQGMFGQPPQQQQQQVSAPAPMSMVGTQEIYLIEKQSKTQYMHLRDH